MQLIWAKFSVIYILFYKGFMSEKHTGTGRAFWRLVRRIGIWTGIVAGISCSDSVDGVIEPATSGQNKRVLWVIVAFTGNRDFPESKFGIHVGLAFPLDVETIRTAVVTLNHLRHERTTTGRPSFALKNYLYRLLINKKYRGARL